MKYYSFLNRTSDKITTPNLGALSFTPGIGVDMLPLDFL